tara:strand:- start:617 stop:1225 length:609 start_codon:yes stop_codon:yes gene_type:complete
MRVADERVSEEEPSCFPYLADPDSVDVVGTAIFHDVIDKIWPDDGIISWSHPDQYRRVVELLDVVPPELQGYVGRWFLAKRRELKEGRHWASGIGVLNHSNRLIYACSHLRNWETEGHWQAEVALLTAVRHHQALESGAPATSATLGIGALVEDRPPRTGIAYFYFLLDGEQPHNVPLELRDYVASHYGVYDHQAGTVREAS